MQIDRDTRRLAMLQIYRTVRSADSATMHSEDLEREWRRTGLRVTDMDSAVREMAQRHLLLVRLEGKRRNYQLTDAGVEEFTRAGTAMLFHARVWLKLLWARLRQLPYRLRPQRVQLTERRAGNAG